MGRVGLDEWQLSDSDVLDERAEAPHVVLVQQVLVQRHQAQLVEKFKVRRRYSGYVGYGLEKNRTKADNNLLSFKMG